MIRDEDLDRVKQSPVSDVLEQTEALQKHLKESGYPPLEELEMFMDLLREAILNIAAGDLTRAADSMKQLSTIGSSGLFRGVGEITRNLHESIKEIQNFVEPLLKNINEDELQGLSGKLAHVSTLVKDTSEQTLDLLFARQEVALTDINIYEKIVKMITEDDKKGAVNKLSTLKTHNDELINELTRISELQIHADLVDQLVKKVSKVVVDMEQRLISLIKRFSAITHELPEETVNKGEILHGPTVPGMTPENAATSQDLVDDLLKSLGM